MIKIIIDNLNNCNLYYGINKNFEKAFAFLKTFLEKPLDAGTYEIDGKDVYAMVMDYELKDEGRLETHKEYIDIQAVINGSEIMEYANIDYLTLQEDLTPQKDLLFYEDTPKSSKLKLFNNDFAIFFPNDGHKPGLKGDNGAYVKKIVVKVKA